MILGVNGITSRPSVLFNQSSLKSFTILSIRWESSGSVYTSIFSKFMVIPPRVSLDDPLNATLLIATSVNIPNFSWYSLYSFVKATLN